MKVSIEQGIPEVPKKYTGQASQVAQIMDQAMGVESKPEPVTAPGPQEPETAITDEQSEEHSNIEQFPTGESQAEETASEQPQQQKMKTLSEAAEKLGIDVSELYGLEIPIGNDEPITLGQFKDKYQEWHGLEGRDAQITEKQNELEVEQLQARQEVAQLVTALQMSGHQIPEAAQQIIQQMHTREVAYLEQQRGLMLTQKPEWKDKDAFMSDRDKIVNHLNSNGLGFLLNSPQGISNAAAMLYFNRMADLEAKLKSINKKTRAQKKPPKQGAPRRGRSTGLLSPEAISRARNGSMSDQVAAVNSLLKG